MPAFSSCLARAAGIETLEQLQAAGGSVQHGCGTTRRTFPTTCTYACTCPGTCRPHPNPNPNPNPNPVSPLPLADTSPAVDLAIDLPMGSWLGFHDGETPLLAKVALHDPASDMYIFVNREGVKMREISQTQLLALMQQDLVDILETRSSFRSQVSQIRDPDPLDTQEN